MTIDFNDIPSKVGSLSNLVDSDETIYYRSSIAYKIKYGDSMSQLVQEANPNNRVLIKSLSDLPAAVTTPNGIRRPLLTNTVYYLAVDELVDPEGLFIPDGANITIKSDSSNNKWIYSGTGDHISSNNSGFVNIETISFETLVTNRPAADQPYAGTQWATLKTSLVGLLPAILLKIQDVNIRGYERGFTAENYGVETSLLDIRFVKFGVKEIDCAVNHENLRVLNGTPVTGALLYEYTLTTQAIFAICTLNAPLIFPLPGEIGLEIEKITPIPGPSKINNGVFFGAGGTVFNPGDKNGVITNFTDAGGGIVTCDATSHGLVNGEHAIIRGNNPFVGGYIVSNVTTNTFDITANFGAFGSLFVDATFSNGSALPSDPILVAKNIDPIIESGAIAQLNLTADATTTISTANQHTIISTGSWESSSNNERFAQLSDGTLIYTGLTPFRTKFKFSASISKVSGGTTSAGIGIFINGSLLSGSEITTGVTSGSFSNLTSFVIYTFQPGDYINPSVINVDNTVNITTEINSRIVI